LHLFIILNLLLFILFFILDATKNKHKVVDCSKAVMKEHCYWPLVSDLNNVLSHRPIAIKFMSDKRLLDSWFSYLSMFQGIFHYSFYIN
jgi:E3 ubiquitin-protein ligase UBR3